MTHISQPRGYAMTRLSLLVPLVAILLIGCGKKAPDIAVAAKDASEKSSPSSGAGHDPCSLLEPKELEAALGGSLVGPPYLFNRYSKGGPAANGDACRYEGRDYHFIQIEVEWTGGAQMMNMYGTVQNLANQKMKGVLKLGDGTELTGEWDEAKAVNCCTFIAMRGDQVVTVDIAGSKATLEQAAAIADAALKRIDKPLPLKGTAGIATAIARDATRPKERDPCSLVSRAEAEAALEFPLVKDPVVEDSKCIYTYTGTGTRPLSVGLDIRWRNGFAVFRGDAAVRANVGKALGLGSHTAQDKKESTVPDPVLAGPWEAAQVGQGNFSAVKKDVLIKADAYDNKQQERARKLVALAIGKL